MALGFDQHNRTPEHRLTLAQFAGLCLYCLAFGLLMGLIYIIGQS